MSFNSMIILIFMLNFSPSLLYGDGASDLEVYIVHVEAPEARSMSSQQGDLERWYRSFLPTTTATTTTTEVHERLVYSYTSVFKGFAARLSLQEVRAMAEKDGFISARVEKKLSLHTTHSPNFLGLNQNRGFWRSSNYGKGVIIGVLDTGALPDHPSFSEEGMPPPPEKWKGRCEFTHTTCNNKIIGARNFFPFDQSPLDGIGHGTHTASTAAGNFVGGANYFGNANGTASGVAPLAHLAIYKVCSSSCYESGVVAAIDAAIGDGVDVLSISLGGYSTDFYEDNIAIGTFRAMQRGILVSCSAGNNGPSIASLSNEAPWVLTVGASTIDRSIRSTAVLGNNHTIDGQSAFHPPQDFPTTLVPLVYPELLNTSDDIDLPFCGLETMKQIQKFVKGKIVVCMLDSDSLGRVEMGETVKEAGGVGLILLNPREFAYTTFSEIDALPATQVSYADGLKIIAYVKSTSTPMATIRFKGTIIGDDRAPVVAAFSSRGPSRVSPGILKPDILGPGVNVLAAWPVSVEHNTNTRSKSTFNIVSGTSMSTPHLSGVAALLKTAHPDWSPAAIKSAIMTTADVVNRGRSPILDGDFLRANIFETGSGHVNPSRANEPGLVYDLASDDYIAFMCGLNYTDRQIGLIMQSEVNCSALQTIPQAQLNYPSFAIIFKAWQPPSQTYTRTVTNVGEPNSTYVVDIVPPLGISVVVEPAKLEFSEVRRKLQYKVTFTRSAMSPESGSSFVEGFLEWKSSRHSVRSPIVVTLNPPELLAN